MFSPAPSQSTNDPLNPPPQSFKPSFSSGKISQEAEEEVPEESYYHSFHSNGRRDSQIHSEEDGSVFEDNSHLNGDGNTACETAFDTRGVESGKEESHDNKVVVGDSRVGSEGSQGHEVQQDPALCSGAFDNPGETPLIPMTLYLHRVKSLVLALLVEPHFLSDTASMEEVVRTKSNLLKANVFNLFYIIPLNVLSFFSGTNRNSLTQLMKYITMSTSLFHQLCLIRI